MKKILCSFLVRAAARTVTITLPIFICYLPKDCIDNCSKNSITSGSLKPLNEAYRYYVISLSNIVTQKILKSLPCYNL